MDGASSETRASPVLQAAMSGNQRSPYDARRSPTTLHYRASYSSDGQHPRPNQYDPTTPVHTHSPVAYNANNHPSASTRLPPPSTSSTGTFYDPTQAERSEPSTNWGGYPGYSRQSSQSQHSPVVRWPELLSLFWGVLGFFVLTIAATIRLPREFITE